MLCDFVPKLVCADSRVKMYCPLLCDQCEKPTTTKPVTTTPMTTPMTTEPMTTEPKTTEPMTTEPMTTEPMTTEPMTTNRKYLYIYNFFSVFLNLQIFSQRQYSLQLT